MEGTTYTSLWPSTLIYKLDKYKPSFSQWSDGTHAKTNSGNIANSLKGHINALLMANTKYFCSKIPVPLLIFFFRRMKG